MKFPLRTALLIGAVCTLGAGLSGAKFALGQPAHFLVAERPEFAVHGDSYVLPLTVRRRSIMRER
jgi:hypothetical protein